MTEEQTERMVAALEKVATELGSQTRAMELIYELLRYRLR